MVRTAACPVCGKDTGEFRYVKAGFSLFRCALCTLLFVGDPPADTSALYDASYFFGGSARGGYVDYDAEKQAMRSTFARSLDLLERFVPTGRLLDVGAATGFFLALAKERGWDVRGVELSPAAVAVAATRGIEVVAGTLETAPYEERSFDAVTMFDVLEHVQRPAALVERTRQLLRPGGALVINTPDSASVCARLMARRWHLLCPPEHLALFNQRSLAKLLGDHGFELKWSGRLAKRFTLPYVLDTAARWLSIPALRALAGRLRDSPLGGITIPLDLRDNLAVVAERR